MSAIIAEANEQLEGTGVSLSPRGRGYVFVKGNDVFHMSTFTGKRIRELTVAQLVSFGKQIAEGSVTADSELTVARESKADRMKRNEETHEVIARLASRDNLNATVKITKVNDALAGTDIQFARIGRGYGFKFGHTGQLSRLDNCTKKKFEELSVTELVELAKQIASGVSEVELYRASYDAAIKTYTVETKEVAAGWNDSGFRHRVVCSDGRVSRWAPYAIVSYLDDCASVSPYFTDGADMQTMTVQEAMRLLAYGEETGDLTPLKYESDLVLEFEDAEEDPTSLTALSRYLSDTECTSYEKLSELSVPKLKMFAEQNSIDVSACTTVHEYALVMLKLLTPNAIYEFVKVNAIQKDDTVWFAAYNINGEIIPVDIQRLAKHFAIPTICGHGPVAAGSIIESVLNKYGLDSLVEAMQKLNIEIKFDLEAARAQLINTATVH